MQEFKKYKTDYSGGALYVENINWNDKGLVVELETEKSREKIKLVFEKIRSIFI